MQAFRNSGIFPISEAWAPAGIFVGGIERALKRPPSRQKRPPPKKKNCASTVLRGMLSRENVNSCAPYYILVASQQERIRFHFGGKVQSNFRNWGCMHGAERLLGRFGVCSPEFFLKNGAIWKVLENILLQICQKKIVKMFIFYTKVIDIVLLRTIYRGIGAYSPECLFIVQFGASWNIF